MSKKSIVIVGGGTAATGLVTALETAFKKLPNPSEYEIVLITGRDYFFHLIAGLRANVSGADIAENIAVPYDKLIKNPAVSRLIQSKKAVDVTDRAVILEGGEQVPYTYLVVATGKQWTSPVDVPDKRVAAIEKMKVYREKVKAAKNILILGGGAVGIEMAGELGESYPKASGKKITLIHNGQKLLNDTYVPKFRDGLAKQLLSLGVNLHLGDSVEGDFDFDSTSNHTITTRNGVTFKNVDLVIRATGGRVNSQVLENYLPRSLIARGGVKVKDTFQVEGHNNLFVIGDLADLKEQKQAAKIPGHVAIAAKNIVALIKGTPLSPYKAPGEMAVVTVGKGGMGLLTLPAFGQVTLGSWFAGSVKSKGLFIAQTRTALGY